MRRRKFLAGAGALAAIPGMGHADPHPQGKTPEQHSALPPGITPSAFANDKTAAAQNCTLKDSIYA